MCSWLVTFNRQLDSYYTVLYLLNFNDMDFEKSYFCPWSGHFKRKIETLKIRRNEFTCTFALEEQSAGTTKRPRTYTEAIITVKYFDKIKSMSKN